MTEQKQWFNMTDEEWAEERERIRKIQDRHFHEGE